MTHILITPQERDALQSLMPPNVVASREDVSASDETLRGLLARGLIWQPGVKLYRIRADGVRALQGGTYP